MMNKTGLLIRKDLIYLCTSLKRLVIMSVLFSLFFPMGSAAFAFVIPPILTYLLTYGVFSYEEKNKMHLLNISLPVDRKALCASKYLTGVIYAFASTLLATLGTSISTVLHLTHTGEWSISFILQMMCILLGTALVYNAVILPVIIYFGALQMKYIAFFLYCSAFAIVGILGSGDNIKMMQGFMQNTLSHYSVLIVLVMSIIIYTISYIISIGLYNRKEFK